MNLKLHNLTYTTLQRCHLPVPPSLHGVSWAQFPRFGGTLRHADSSPPIPPRFVAFARRYHPSTCGSLRRTPGATSTASGVVSRCPPPGGLYDGDDEASRVPGKPTRTHATRSDPGEVAASTASETRRDDLPSNARRRPSQTMHFGAQSRGLRAPCERFAPGVSPGPRITRFRLAAGRASFLENSPIVPSAWAVGAKVQANKVTGRLQRLAD